MKYIECVRVLDDHVFGKIGLNWYYICEGVHYVEVGNQYVEVKCDSYAAQLKSIFTISTRETVSGIVVTRNEYTRRGDFRKKEFYLADDIIRMGKDKVSTNPEYFSKMFETLHDMDIRKESSIL